MLDAGLQAAAAKWALWHGEWGDGRRWRCAQRGAAGKIRQISDCRSCRKSIICKPLSLSFRIASSSAIQEGGFLSAVGNDHTRTQKAQPELTATSSDIFVAVSRRVARLSSLVRFWIDRNSLRIRVALCSTWRGRLRR